MRDKEFRPWVSQDVVLWDPVHGFDVGSVWETLLALPNELKEENREGRLKLLRSRRRYFTDTSALVMLQ